MLKMLLTGVATLFLATGVAYTQEADIHHDDGQKYATMLNTQEKCADILEMAEARSKARKETWINWTQGKSERILNVMCPGAPSNQCPPSVAGKTPDGKAC